MTIKDKIKLYQHRISILKEKGEVRNANIIRKINREIRNLEQES